MLEDYADAIELTDGIVFLTCGVMLLAVWWTSQRMPHLLAFGLGLYLNGFTTIALTDLEGPASLLARLGWAGGGTAMIAGFRLLDGRRVATPGLVVLLFLPAAVSLTLFLAGLPLPEVRFFSILAHVVLTLAVAHAACPPRTRSLYRRMQGMVFIAISLTLLADGVLNELGLQTEQVLLSTMNHCYTIVLTVAILALEAERMRQLVVTASQTDTLTGAFNRSGFSPILGGHMPGAVLVADLDRFKLINDTHGHAAGDEVLRETVRRMRLCLPGGCTLARLGGEEFAIVLPGASLEDARAMAERVRAAVSAMPVSFRDRQVKVTTSIGVCVIEATEIVAQAIERADRALYDAKMAGRDLVRAA